MLSGKLLVVTLFVRSVHRDADQNGNLLRNLLRDDFFATPGGNSLSYRPGKDHGHGQSPPVELGRRRDETAAPATPGQKTSSSDALEMLLASKIVKGTVRHRLWEEDAASPWNRSNVAVSQPRRIAYASSAGRRSLSISLLIA